MPKCSLFPNQYQFVKFGFDNEFFNLVPAKVSSNNKVSQPNNQVRPPPKSLPLGLIELDASSKSSLKEAAQEGQTKKEPSESSRTLG